MATRNFGGLSGDLEDDESGRTYDLDFETFTAPTALVLSDLTLALNQTLHLSIAVSVEVGPFFNPPVPDRAYPISFVEITTTP
jgi:hypothetical protein